MSYYSLFVNDIGDFDVLVEQIDSTRQIEILSEDGMISITIIEDGDIVTSECVSLE